VAGFFDSMRFMLQVEVTDVTAELAVVWEPCTASAPGTDGLARLERQGPDSLGGRELFLPRERLEEYAEQAGPPAGIWAYEALRVAAHVPRHGKETDHKTIPNEVGWLDTAVHLEKGCYRGQETVARIHNLGRPPRRLTFLHLDGSVDTLPPHDAPVELAGRQVGFVTSSARHAELGPIALALLKRNTPVDATLLAGGVAATQEVVVDPDVGVHFRPPR
ncbi:MAG TPA: folate-binding protein, partial [Actinopolymorphaceae bacterium]